MHPLLRRAPALLLTWALISTAMPCVADELRLGSLHLQRCVIGSTRAGGTARAWCTTFTVPEDHQQPGGRQIALRVALISAAAPLAARDLAVFLDGGPGGAATEDYAAYAPAFAELGRRRHLLLLDQRGTGGSNALSCGQEPSAAALPDARALRSCLARLRQRADPRFYTTTDAIQDLEQLRRALGGPQLDLIAVSYGTRVAQQYARRYPAAVRSIVLDSAVPSTLALGSEHAANLESVLKARFAACARDESCRQKFGDPYRALYELRDRLRRRPADVTGLDPVSNAVVHRMLGEGELAGTVRLLAYSPVTAALLPLSINEALHGNFAPLLGQQRLAMDDVSGRLTDGMGLSVECSEDADLLSSRPEDADTLLGNSLVDGQRAACAEWPRGTRPGDFHEPFTSALPTLLLAGELDPVTPPRYAAAIATGLPHSRVLVLRGQGHGVMTSGCAPRLVGDFIEHLDPAALNAQCLDALDDTPAYLDFNGAAP